MVASDSKLIPSTTSSNFRRSMWGKIPSRPEISLITMDTTRDAVEGLWRSTRCKWKRMMINIDSFTKIYHTLSKDLFSRGGGVAVVLFVWHWFCVKRLVCRGIPCGAPHPHHRNSPRMLLRCLKKMRDLTHTNSTEKWDSCLATNHWWEKVGQLHNKQANDKTCQIFGWSLFIGCALCHRFLYNNCKCLLCIIWSALPPCQL